MYRVIIVDDEKQIIDGLCRMIRWSELGYEVVGTARNGVEAIALIPSLRPDLVVTDVRMPEMDGLKMLEHVRRHMAQDVEFIILSGFSDFQYARTAMQYNVKSYILKPIDEPELYGALLDIKAVLDEKEIRKSMRIQSCINGCIAGLQPAMGEAFPTDEEQAGLRYLAVERRVEYASLSSLRAQGGPDLFNTLTGLLGKSNMRFVLRQDRDRCNIVAGKSLLQPHGLSPRLFAHFLQDRLYNAAEISADILVGALAAGMRDLHQSVQSISQCRSRLFYLNKASIVFYDDIREETFCKVCQDNGLGVKIIAAFRKNDMERLAHSVSEMVEHFTQLKVAPEIALVHLDSAMASVLQILSESREDIGMVLEQYAFFKGIQNRISIHSLGQLAVQFCTACSELSVAGKKAEHADIVTRVVRYVDENYAQPLKINDIAERFYVNPAYLGQQFARKMGCPLNHYINSVRMERAKELLAGTARRIYEVALETGFDDPNYFSCKFVEYTGRTPSEYRSQSEAAAPRRQHR